MADREDDSESCSGRDDDVPRSEERATSAKSVASALRPELGSTIRRISWATDVHLNFLDAEGISAFHRTVADQEADALLITGDIAEAPGLERFLEDLADAVAKPIFFVLGNHDYYRGSLASVRGSVKALCARSEWLHWLPLAGVVELSPFVALIGVDGWADGQLGDYERSTVLLNDYLYIEDLARFTKRARHARLAELGEAEAKRLSVLLDRALDRPRTRVVVATHVPPFREACWHEGHISNDAWLPHFACKATGDVLRQVAERHPACAFTVLCGHTHSAGVASILPNLSAMTGAAEYGEPRVQGVLHVAEGGDPWPHVD